MAAKTLHFHAGNGDMTLMVLESGWRLLVDIDIRQAIGDDLDLPDVATQLRTELSDMGRDREGRLYVDAFLLTHPDQDHIRGFASSFPSRCARRLVRETRQDFHPRAVVVPDCLQMRIERPHLMCRCLRLVLRSASPC